MSATLPAGPMPPVPAGTPADEAEALAAAHRLVATTRRLMLAVATTEADVAAMREAEHTLAMVADRLGERARPRQRRIPFDAEGVARAQAGHPWEHFSFNPLGIPFVAHIDGPRASAALDLTALHEGPPGLLHGGFSAALMDALLGTLVQAQGTPSVTATLEVRFRRPTPLDARVELGGEVVRVEGRKTWAEGWIARDGERTVEARGLFVRMAD